MRELYWLASMHRLLHCSLLLVLLTSAHASAAPAAVAVNGGVSYQTIDGFGASVSSASWDGGAVKPALDQLDAMGVRTWRVVIEMTDWEVTNDDADPAHFNWTQYNAIFSSPRFEELWSMIGYLNQKGYSSSVMLDFMGRVPPWMGGDSLTPSLKDEFVETVVAAAYYGRVTRGVKFGMLAPANETDWDGIEGPRIGDLDFGDVMNRIALRLDATAGLTDLKLVGPDCAAGQNAVDDYIPAMTSHPRLMAHVNAFAIHEYSPTTHGLAAAITASAYPDRHAWVSETSSIFAAWTHLEQGVSAVLLWDGYDSVYNHAILAGRGSTPPNDAGPEAAPLALTAGVYYPRHLYYEWQQLFRFVAPGALRIAANTAASGVHALAFRHPTSGQLTIVGRNDNAGSQALSFSLAAVGNPQSFTVYATSQSQEFTRLADVPIVGDTAAFTAPPNSFFTLTATAATVSAPAPAAVPGWATLMAGVALGCAGVALRRPRATCGV